MAYHRMTGPMVIFIAIGHGLILHHHESSSRSPRAPVGIELASLNGTREGEGHLP